MIGTVLFFIGLTTGLGQRAIQHKKWFEATFFIGFAVWITLTAL